MNTHVPSPMRPTVIALALVAAALWHPASAAAQDNPFSSCKTQNGDSRGQSLTPQPIPERPGAVLDIITGSPVVIVCDDITFEADHVEYESDTRLIHARGNVLFQQNDLRISADHAELDGKTRLGTFYDAVGAARLAQAGKMDQSQFGALEPDVLFYGAKIERVAVKTYRITEGGFTTCAQPTPRWQMTESSGTITVDKSAFLRNVVFKVKDVPLLYLPAFYYPINKEGRSTGFLMPTYGSSTISGTTISNAFFWAINRSQDATFYDDWKTKTGQGLGTEYRYVYSPTSRGTIKFYMLNQSALLANDGSVESPAVRSYQIDGSANQMLPHGLSAIGRIDYFTDAATQQLYQDVYDSSQRTSSFSGTLSGGFNRFRFSLGATRNDTYTGTAAGTRTGTLPSASLQMAEKPIGKTKIYYGAAGEVDDIVRQDDLSDPTTNRSLWRFDGAPTIRAPFSSLPYFSATAAASWRFTYWQQSVDPGTGQQVALPITRQIVDMNLKLDGPTFERVFLTPHNGYADRFKHIIEPTVTIDHTTPFAELDEVVQNDSVDRVVGGDTTVSYGLSNRLLARRVQKPGPDGNVPPPVVRDIFDVDIDQSYYTNSLASAFDPNYQSNSIGEVIPAKPNPFSPVSLSFKGSPGESTSAQLRMEFDSQYRVLRTLSATGSVNTHALQLSVNWSKREAIPEIPGFEIGADSIGGSVRLRTAENRIGASYSFDIDVADRAFPNQRVLFYYNSQCCGLNIDWQSASTPLQNIAADRRFAISFSLAGIGSFSNPLGSFGGGR